jgi:hypothetical protein
VTLAIAPKNVFLHFSINALFKRAEIKAGISFRVTASTSFEEEQSLTVVFGQSLPLYSCRNFLLSSN